MRKQYRGLPVTQKQFIFFSVENVNTYLVFILIKWINSQDMNALNAEKSRP
jgi:hypothetical protein